MKYIQITIKMAQFISIIDDTLGGDSPNQTKKVFDKEFNNTDDIDLYNWTQNNNSKKMVYIYKNPLYTKTIISSLCMNSDIKLLYFSNYHDLDDKNNNLLSEITNNSNIRPEQVVLIGLNDEDYDIDYEGLENLNIEYYTLSIIRKKGIDTILNKVYDNTKTIAYFNLEVFSTKIAPSVERRNLSIGDEITLDETNKKKVYSGLNYEELETIAKFLLDKVEYLLISGFNSSIDNETHFFSRMTSEVVQILYRNIMNIKEKKINVFNENSRFLIFRKMKQESDDDIGWYILRFISMDDRLKMLESIEDSKIYTFDLSDFTEENSETSEDEMLDGEILITATNIDDQQCKSYYAATTIMDCTLFPQEKFLMGFELVNF